MAILAEHVGFRGRRGRWRSGRRTRPSWRPRSCKHVGQPQRPAASSTWKQCRSNAERRSSAEVDDAPPEVFTPALYHPPPQFFYDAEPAPSAPPEAPVPNKRRCKPSLKARESADAAPEPLRASAPRAAAPREATHGWCYGAFEGVSEVRADGTLVQGWLKVPIEVGDDLGENDEAMAPVPEWDFSEFDRYVGTYNPQANVPVAQQPVPGAIDVGDYYITNDDQILRAIGEAVPSSTACCGR